MSYPSIAQVISNDGIDQNTASDLELTNALWTAFRIDLPDGISWLTNRFENVPPGEQTEVDWIDPNSELGKQLVRLIGCDISRKICENKLGVTFGMYNCCGITGVKNDPSKPPEKPKMSLLTQINAQLTPDC